MCRVDALIPLFPMAKTALWLWIATVAPGGAAALRHFSGGSNHPCHPSPDGPFFTCTADADCAECPSSDYYFAFCDTGVGPPAVCHFNNDGRGVRLADGPADDLDLFRVVVGIGRSNNDRRGGGNDGEECEQLTVYHLNSHYACFEAWWASPRGSSYFAPKHGFHNGTCPGVFARPQCNATTIAEVCAGQGAPTTTHMRYTCD